MDIVSICRAAWQQTKQPHQPDYDDLVEAYRIMLVARAEGVIATGSISEDAPFQPFEKATLERPPEPESKPSEAEMVVSGPISKPLSPEVAQMEEERIERAAKREAAQPKKKPTAKKTTPKKTVKPAVKKAVRKSAKKVMPKK